TNPPDLTLAGNGTAAAQPAIAVVPGTLTFSVTAGAASAGSQTLTLQSTGTAVLHVNSVRIGSGAFTLAPATAGGCALSAFDLQPGQSCGLTVTWASTAAGTETGTVVIDSTAAAAPTQVALQAVRTSATAPDATAPGLSNVGAGGCSIARPAAATDPTLWLLALAAVAVVWRRRAGR
ncbi:MAG: choice-of-anchor D domain-containing protein, partial [Burkholderiales bacterium]|nr:choice-of-anchor D domain-containing protein [Burkholderiales bacterium]